MGNHPAASDAPAVVPSSPNPPSSSTRYNRVQSLASKPSFPHLNGHSNAISTATTATPFTSGYNTPIGQTLHHAVERAEVALAKLAQQQEHKPVGKIAQWLIHHVTRLEQALQHEIYSRTNAIGGLDNMWLLINDISAFNPVCMGTYTFAETPDKERITQSMLSQLSAFPKYTQKLADTHRLFHGAIFVDDPEFDITNHIQVHKLPGDAGKLQLEKFASEYLAQGWDYSKPLWDLVIIDNFSDPDTGAKGAMITRGHHTLADGQGFVMSQLFVTTLGPKLESMMADGAQLLSDARIGKALPSRVSKRLKPLDKYQGTLALQLTMLLLYWTSAYISFLTDLAGSFTLFFVTAYFSISTFWRQRYVTANYPGPRKYEKEFSTSRSFPLGEVKRISKAFSGVAPGSIADLLQGRKRHSRPLIGNHLTVNDIICTVIADVINDELDKKTPEPGLFEAVKRFFRWLGPNPIGIMIPISIRAPGDWSMRNLSTGAIAYLPTTKGLPTDPKVLHKRLHTTSKRLAVLKNSLLPKIFFYLIQLTGQAPALFPVPFALLPASRFNPLRYITVKITEIVMTSFTAVVTNVPCPSKQRIQLGGDEVVRWTALPPQAGKGTLGIGICSYAGEVSISISADKAPGSEGVAKRLTDSFEQRWQQYLDAADSLIQPTQKGSSRANGDAEPKKEK